MHDLESKKALDDKIEARLKEAVVEFKAARKAA
jgi:hypothetical protein